MRSLLLVLVLSTNLSLLAQSNELLQQADSLYKANNYAASAENYQSYIESEEVEDPWVYYNMACSWALAEKVDQAFSALRGASDRGFRFGDHARRDTDLKTLRGKQGWNEILAQFDENLNNFNSQYNLPLLEQLEQMYDDDQTLRQLYFSAMDKFARGTREFNTFLGIMAEKDSVNQLKLKQMLEKHGWLGRSEVGGKANAAQYLIIQHADRETQEMALPLLRASVAEGESSMSNLAYLEDRVNMYNGLPQRYGTQSIWIDSLQINQIYTLEDSTKVNEWRRQAGLRPLKAYMK